MGSLKRIARLGSVSLGSGFPVRIMAAVNISPESFYKGSVATTPGEILARAKDAAEKGADIIDIGAMSTAPYLKNEISEDEEASRVRMALRAIERIATHRLRRYAARFCRRGGVQNPASRSSMTCQG